MLVREIMKLNKGKRRHIKQHMLPLNLNKDYIDQEFQNSPQGTKQANETNEMTTKKKTTMKNYGPSRKWKILNKRPTTKSEKMGIDDLIHTAEDVGSVNDEFEEVKSEK